MEIAIQQETRTYTIKQMFEALKQNGFEHLRGEWISGEGQVVGACVLGQALSNLNAVSQEDLQRSGMGADIKVADSLVDQLNRFEISPDSKWAGQNWVENEEYAEEGYWLYSPESLSLGEVIIYWNDQAIDYYNQKYFLQTYEEVVDMAYDVLSPYFDETIELPHYEY